MIKNRPPLCSSFHISDHLCIFCVFTLLIKFSLFTMHHFPWLSKAINLLDHLEMVYVYQMHQMTNLKR